MKTMAFHLLLRRDPSTLPCLCYLITLMKGGSPVWLMAPVELINAPQGQPLWGAFLNFSWLGESMMITHQPLRGGMGFMIFTLHWRGLKHSVGQPFDFSVRLLKGTGHLWDVVIWETHYTIHILIQLSCVMYHDMYHGLSAISYNLGPYNKQHYELLYDIWQSVSQNTSCVSHYSSWASWLIHHIGISNVCFVAAPVTLNIFWYHFVQIIPNKIIFTINSNYHGY